MPFIDIDSKINNKVYGENMRKKTIEIESSQK